MDNISIPYIFFSTLKGFGPITVNQLIGVFGTIHAAYYASEKDLIHVLPQQKISLLLQHKRAFKHQEFLQHLINQNIHIIHREHAYYPENFMNLHDAPICLYAKGNLDLLTTKNAISIVGTRLPSNYGSLQVQQFVKGFKVVFNFNPYLINP